MEDKYNESMEYVLRYEKIINEQGKKIMNIIIN